MSAKIKPGRVCPKCAGNLDAACHAPGCLSSSQIAIRAAMRYLEQPRRKRGRSSAKCPPVGISREALAEEVGIGKALLDEAIRVAEILSGRDPATIERIEQGSLVVGDTYDEIIRAERRKTLLANVAAPPDNKFQIILADPAWQYQDDGVGRRGAAESQYPTTSMDALVAMRPMIDRVSASNAMIVMWATSALLPEAIRLMEAWGFEYISSAIWHKTGRMGMGSIFRIDHEFLLVGRRGDGLPVATDARDIRSVIPAKPMGHSVKPDELYGIIERFWPDASKIELFARRARAGWTAWGAEARRTGHPEAVNNDGTLPRAAVVADRLPDVA